MPSPQSPPQYPSLACFVSGSRPVNPLIQVCVVMIRLMPFLCSPLHSLISCANHRHSHLIHCLMLLIRSIAEFSSFLLWLVLSHDLPNRKGKAPVPMLTSLHTYIIGRIDTFTNAPRPAADYATPTCEHLSPGRFRSRRILLLRTPCRLPATNRRKQAEEHLNPSIESRFDTFYYCSGF